MTVVGGQNNRTYVIEFICDSAASDPIVTFVSYSNYQLTLKMKGREICNQVKCSSCFSDYDCNSPSCPTCYKGQCTNARYNELVIVDSHVALIVIAL